MRRAPNALPPNARNNQLINVRSADASAAAPAADAARRDVAAALVLAAALAVTTVCGQCHAFGKAWCRENHGPPAATAI